MSKKWDQVVCKICGYDGCDTMNFKYHIKKHEEVKNSREYYDRYIKSENEGKCLQCGKNTRFENIIKGYCDYCSKTCAQSSDIVKSIVKDSIVEKYGEYYNNRSQAKQTCIKKYGCSNISQIDYIKKKKEKTFKEKYGVSSFVQTEEHRMYMECNYGWVSKENKDEYELYYNECWKETHKYVNLLFYEWDGFDYYDCSKLLTDKNEYNNPMYRTIDHKISIKFGFDNNIPPYEIGNIENLCICSRSNNSSKKHLTDKEYRVLYGTDWN